MKKVALGLITGCFQTTYLFHLATSIQHQSFSNWILVAGFSISNSLLKHDLCFLVVLWQYQNNCRRACRAGAEWESFQVFILPRVRKEIETVSFHKGNKAFFSIYLLLSPLVFTLFFFFFSRIKFFSLNFMASRRFLSSEPENTFNYWILVKEQNCLLSASPVGHKPCSYIDLGIYCIYIVEVSCIFILSIFKSFITEFCFGQDSQNQRKGLKYRFYLNQNEENSYFPKALRQIAMWKTECPTVIFLLTNEMGNRLFKDSWRFIWNGQESYCCFSYWNK